MRNHQVLSATIVLLSMCCSYVTAAIITGPSPYLSVLDTPAGVFTPGAPVILQDFEDADGPWEVGFSIDIGMRIPPNFTAGGTVPINDSVDADDFAIDGDGTQGASWYAITRVLTITFDEIVPRASFVWTDGDRILTNVKVEVIGPDDSVTAFIDAGDLADDVFTGTTQEDRFFGATDASGIKAFRVSIDQGEGIEIDHVRFELVPEPSSLLLILFGFGGLRGVVRGSHFQGPLGARSAR